MIAIHEARRYAYKDTGELVYDCDNCQFPNKHKVERLGCPKVGMQGQAVDCKFKTCPGDAISSPLVSEFYELIRMVDGIPLINLYKHSNILFEVALLEHAYKVAQQHDQLKVVQDVNRRAQDYSK
jgi:hypothetical protein